MQRASKGRLAKIMSFLVKHSSAADGGETTRTACDPNLKKSMGHSDLQSWIEFCRGVLQEVEVANDE